MKCPVADSALCLRCKHFNHEFQGCWHGYNYCGESCVDFVEEDA